MFGLTKREQRWAAEQKAVETIFGFAMQVVAAEVASDTKAFKDVVTERDELLEMNEQLRNQDASLDAKCAEYEKSAATQPPSAAMQPPGANWSVKVTDWNPPRVQLTIGDQSFCLDVEYDRAEPGRQQWYAEQLTTAIANIRHAEYQPPSAVVQPLEKDPLQGAVDWLLQADGEFFCVATVQRTLRIGYNRAQRLCDTASERANNITKAAL